MGSTPKFKAGDPVWVLSVSTERPTGEYAGVIIAVTDKLCTAHDAILYGVEIPFCPHPTGIAGWAVCEPYLRPRRDDYQQHEPLGSKKDLDKILSEDGRISIAGTDDRLLGNRPELTIIDDVER